jgi:hypothetical protein
MPGFIPRILFWSACRQVILMCSTIAKKTDTNAGFKYLLLKFPSDQELSSQAIYAGAGEDEKLQLKGVKCRSVYGTNRDVYDVGFVAWKVARMDVAPNKKGKVANTADPVSEAAAAFGAMVLSIGP